MVFASTRRGSGGDGIDAVARSELATKADQSALDDLSAAAATKSELAAIQTQVNNLPEGVVVVSAVRQEDQSILITYSDSSTGTIAASAPAVWTGNSAQFAAITPQQNVRYEIYENDVIGDP